MSTNLEHAAVVTVPTLLSIAHTAVVLDCSVRTVRRRIQTGQLPAVLEGERTMVRGDDLAAYIDNLTRPGGARQPRTSPRRDEYDFLA